MCGSLRLEGLRYFKRFPDSFDFESRGQESGRVLPGARVSLVTTPKTDTGKGKPVVRSTRWGVLPDWTDNLIFNVRSESAHLKKMWTPSLMHRRGLLFFSSFLEGGMFWQATDTAMACLFGCEKKDDMAILTCTSKGELESYHHRMPVLLPKPLWYSWLSRDTGLEGAMRLMEKREIPSPNR